MWTHKHCYLKNTPISDDITKIAELEIAQSLKFGRTIAIIGSGMSAAYGHLLWDELAKFIILDTLDNVKKSDNVKRSNVEDVKKIKTEIINLAKIDETLLNEGGDAMLTSNKIKVDTVLLQLCRHIRKLIGEEENTLDETVRNIFSGSSIDKFKSRLRCVSYDAYTDLTEIENKPSNSAKKRKTEHKSYIELEKYLFEKLKNEYSTIKKDREDMIMEIFQELYIFDELASKSNSVIDSDSEQKDPYNIIIHKMELNRFVTLNFDEEIEATFKKFGFTDKSFEKKDINYVKNYVNGYGAYLISKSPTEDSVGDLLIFSSTTTESSATVFHLHGSTTSAKDSRLVLSEDDYQNQYLRGLERRIVFDEGLRTLFGGNDILFLGVGMREEDLLHPLRQYLAERPKFPRQARILVALKEYLNNNLDKNREILSMKYKYGVRIIGYEVDDEDEDEDEDEDDNSVSNNLKYKSKNSDIIKKRCNFYIKQAERTIGRAAKQCTQLEYMYDFSREWWEAWRKRPKSRLARWNTVNKTTYRYSLIPIQKPENSIQYFNRVKGNIDDCFLEKMSKNKGRRILRFSAQRGYGKGTFTLMLRNDPKRGNLFDSKSEYVASFFADAYFSTEFNSVISSFGVFLFDTIIKLIVKNIKDKGSNKTHEVEDNASMKMFNDKKYFNIIESLKYDNSDLASTVHSIVVDKLIAYLKNGDPYDLKLFRNSFKSSNHKIGKLEIIQKLLFLMDYLLSSNNRIFICLSGLDRICNFHGYAYNPLHRSFFRILATDLDNNKDIQIDKNDKIHSDIKYDLVVVAGEPNAPIRYLSESKENNDNQKNYNYDTQKDLIPWIRLPYPTKFSQITTACEKIVFDFSHRSVFFNCLLMKIKNELFEMDNRYESMCHDLAYILSGENSKKHRVIGILLNVYNNFDKKTSFPGLRNIQIVFKYLAFFSYPVEISVIRECPDIKEMKLDTTWNLNKTVAWMHERGFILCFEGTIYKTDKRYALHRMIRDFLADQMDYAIYDRDEHSFFDVSLFAEQPRDLPSPKYKDYKAIETVLDALNESTTGKLKYLDKKDINYIKNEDTPKFLSEIQKAKTLEELENYCTNLIDIVNTQRAAIHLMNSAFSIGVISRMDDFDFKDLYESNSQTPTPFERYCDTANALLCNAVRVDTALDIIVKRNNKLNKEINECKICDSSNSLLCKTNHNTNDVFLCLDKRIFRVFYPTQIAWLYNEQALTRFVQGRLYESLALFDLALETLKENNWSANMDKSARVDIDYPENSSLRRVLLNKSIALIEFGEIDNAKSILEKLFQRSELHKNSNSLTATLAGVYLGLCSHLRGSYDEARIRYEEALKKLKTVESRERSKALIYKYLGDLDRTENKFKESRLNLELAANFSDTVHQRDVYYQVMVSQAKLYLREEKFVEVFEILKSTELYARKLGIPKLLTDCWMVRGHANLLQKQTTTAGEYLSHAIATSNRNGMVLYKVAALHMYCDVLEARDTLEAKKYANSIRRAAKTRSERIGYPFKIKFKNPKNILKNQII